jgi:2-keto-3-deoxy-6-phosphogluconate aldolase
MKCAVEMGSGAIKFIPSSIQTGPAILKLVGGIYRAHKLVFIFF